MTCWPSSEHPAKISALWSKVVALPQLLLPLNKKPLPNLLLHLSNNSHNNNHSNNNKPLLPLHAAPAGGSMDLSTVPEVILMPRLSDTMTEGVIAEWHKKVGDAVKKGDLLADVETDKATMELGKL